MDDIDLTRAEEIFSAALELDELGRKQYLSTQCGDRLELRRTVEGLLVAHADAGSFLSQPVDGRQVATALRATQAEDEKAEYLLERYRLVERIGEGGMGVVWRAQQIEGVRRQVAVKLIKGGFVTAEAVTRFEIERQALARMNHPHIAKVLDAGTTSTGRPFFVMELVAGKPLVAFCDEQRLPIRERLRLFLMVTDAIQHAHQNGIIHRDLKPANVLVEQQEGRAVPKVIDFGLAKALIEDLSESTLHTVAGVMLGTPAYMSPEQTHLDHRGADTRSDVFSLGVLLYELLTGTTPISREKLAGLSLEASFAQVRENETQPPSARLKGLGRRLVAVAAQRSEAPARLVAALRDDLDWISLKALEKDPSRRYQTANEFGADVSRHLTDEPVLVRPPSARYRLRKFVKKHRLGASLTAGLTLVLITGTAVALTLLFRARESEADLAAFAAFLTDDVLATARPADLEGGLGIEIKVRDALVAAVEKIPKRFSGRPRAEALTRHTLGITFADLGEIRRAVPELERALDLRRRALGGLDPKTLATMSRLGQAASQPGQAVALLTEALRGYEAVLGPDHIDTIETMARLGNFYSRADTYLDLARAVSIGNQALERSLRTHGPKASLTHLCMILLGETYFQVGRFTEAATLHENVLAQLRATLPPSSPYISLVMNDLALAYLGARQMEKAISLHREAMILQKAQLGDEHPAVLMSMSNLAYDYLVAENFPAAESLARACVELRRKVLGETHYDTLGAKMTLAQSLLAQNRHREAEQLCREILAIREKAYPNEWRTYASRLLVAESLLGNRREDEARPLLEESFQQLKAARATISVWSTAVTSSLERIVRLHEFEGAAEPLKMWEERRREWSEWLLNRRAEIESAGRGTVVSTLKPERS